MIPRADLLSLPYTEVENLCRFSIHCVLEDLAALHDPVLLGAINDCHKAEKDSSLLNPNRTQKIEKRFNSDIMQGSQI